MKSKQIKVIFTYSDSLGKGFNFLAIPDEMEFPGFSLGGNCSDFRKLYFSELKFKKGMHPGAVFQIIQNDENNYSWNSSSLPIGKWNVREDLMKWEALNKADERAKQNLKSVNDSEIRETLRPLREAYKEANYRERELILAQTIRAITG